MRDTITIGLIGMAVILMLLPGIAQGIMTGPSVLDEQKTTEKTYVEVKCDPCDYNIDFGDTSAPAAKGGPVSGAGSSPQRC